MSSINQEKDMLIILDRDGVINEDSDAYIKNPSEWIPIPGSLNAIAILNRAGHKVVIATNQSGIARKLYTEAQLHDIHEKMHQSLAKVGGHIDGIFYCPHHPDDHCSCRKPQPGLLLQIAEQFKTNFKNALMIGDTINDIKCAQAVNCNAILVKTGKGVRTLNAHELEQYPHIRIFENLSHVVEALTMYHANTFS